MKDLAFNISITAWTLCDWVFGDLTAEQRKSLNIRKLSDLQDRARSCRAVHICRQAATASKHWDVTSYPDPNLSVIVTAGGQGQWLIYFLDNGDRLEADRVFAEALQFWTSFIYPNRIAAG